MNTDVKINALIQDLTEEEKLHLIAFLETISVQTAKKSPKNLLKFAGTIPNSDLKIMQESIETGCNVIDEDEW